MKNDFHNSPKKIYVCDCRNFCVVVAIIVDTAPPRTPLSRIISYRDHFIWRLSLLLVENYLALLLHISSSFFSQQQLRSNFLLPLLLITSFAWMPLHNCAKDSYFRITFYALNWMLTCCCEISIFPLLAFAHRERGDN